MNRSARNHFENAPEGTLKDVDALPVAETRGHEVGDQNGRRAASEHPFGLVEIPRLLERAGHLGRREVPSMRRRKSVRRCERRRAVWVILVNERQNARLLVVIERFHPWAPPPKSSKKRRLVEGETISANELDAIGACKCITHGEVRRTYHSEARTIPDRALSWNTRCAGFAPSVTVRSDARGAVARCLFFAQPFPMGCGPDPAFWHEVRSQRTLSKAEKPKRAIGFDSVHFKKVHRGGSAMRKPTLTRASARAHSLGAALVCALLFAGLWQRLPRSDHDGIDGQRRQWRGCWSDRNGNGRKHRDGRNGRQSRRHRRRDGSGRRGREARDGAYADGGGNPDVMADVGTGDGFASPESGGGDSGNLNPAVVSDDAQVADWQLPTAGGQKDWIHGALWTGIMATYKATKDEKYMTAIKTGRALVGGSTAATGREATTNARRRRSSMRTWWIRYRPTWSGSPGQGIVRCVGCQHAAGSRGMVVGRRVVHGASRICPPRRRNGDKKYFATMNTMYWDSQMFLFNNQAGLMYRDHRGNDTILGPRQRAG